MNKDELKYSRLLLVLLSMLAFAPIYFKLLNIKILSGGLSLISIGVCLALSVALVYIVYIITSLIELPLLRIFRLIKIKYLIIYPFAYNGKHSFMPIKLLCHQDSIRDSFPINLVIDLQNGETEKQLKSRFKKIIYVREISLLISFFIMFLTIFCFLKINFFIEFIISFIAIILMSCTSDEYWWTGTRYIVKNEEILKNLFSSPNLKEINSEKYGRYLEELYENKTSLNITCIDILENYLFASFYEGENYLTAEALEEICHIILHKDVKLNMKSLRYERQRISLQNMIGLISMKSNNKNYYDVFIRLTNKTLDKLNASNYFNVNTEAIERINEFIDFVSGKTRHIDFKEHFLLNIKDFFSYRSTIEKEIKSFRKNTINTI